MPKPPKPKKLKPLKRNLNIENRAVRNLRYIVGRGRLSGTLADFKECAWCHQPFLPFTRQQIYCSDLCSYQHFNRVRYPKPAPMKCAYCGEVFTPSRKPKGLGFCSSLCCTRFYAGVQPRQAMKCQECGCEFIPDPLGTPPIYCSSACGNKAWIRTHRVQYLEKAKKRSRQKFDRKGFSNPGSPMRLKVVQSGGQERVADAVWLERYSGEKESVRSKELRRLPNVNWRFQGDSGRARRK